MKDLFILSFAALNGWWVFFAIYLLISIVSFAGKEFLKGFIGASANDVYNRLTKKDSVKNGTEYLIGYADNSNNQRYYLNISLFSSNQGNVFWVTALLLILTVLVSVIKF
jgi:hypothetical protein